MLGVERQRALSGGGADGLLQSWRDHGKGGRELLAPWQVIAPYSTLSASSVTWTTDLDSVSAAGERRAVPPGGQRRRMDVAIGS